MINQKHWNYTRNEIGERNLEKIILYHALDIDSSILGRSNAKYIKFLLNVSLKKL